MQITTIGLDLAKHVFQVHGVDDNGAVVIRRRLRRVESSSSSRRCHPAWLGWRLARPRITGRAG